VVVEVKKIYSIIISICLITASIITIWTINERNASKESIELPLNTYNASAFFSRTGDNLPYDENSNWTIYDKVQNVYLYRIPEIDYLKI